jgi:hypothetical protein
MLPAAQNAPAMNSKVLRDKHSQILVDMQNHVEELHEIHKFLTVAAASYTGKSTPIGAARSQKSA